MLKQLVPALAFTVTLLPQVAAANTDMAVGEPKSNQFWWPERVDLSPLRNHVTDSSPYSADFDYAAESRLT